MKKYIKIARPDHWVKNAFIFPGIVIAFLLADFTLTIPQFVIKLICGFIATCFIASANYVINEWLDAEFDQFHPTKKFRPVVSENMKFSLVMVEYAICIIVGVVFSLLVNIPFLVVELILLFMGVVYNVKPIRSKDIVYFDVKEREAGSSKYTIKKMMTLAMDGITSMSVRPLSIITAIGFITVIAAFIMIIYTFVDWCCGNAIQGYTTTLLVTLIIGGVTILSLGIIGEYIGKIYLETKKRPRYIIDSVVLKDCEKKED